MANISLYQLDSAIDGSDKVIGTDGTTGADQGKTKNFTVSALGAHILHTSTLTGGTNVNGDVEVTESANGVILKSPNGTRYRITVDDSGNLTTTSL